MTGGAGSTPGPRDIELTGQEGADRQLGEQQHPDAQEQQRDESNADGSHNQNLVVERTPSPVPEAPAIPSSSRNKNVGS